MKKILLICLFGLSLFGSDDFNASACEKLKVSETGIYTVEEQGTKETCVKFNSDLCSKLKESLPSIYSTFEDIVSIENGAITSCIDVPNVSDKLQSISLSEKYGILVGLKYSISDDLYKSILKDLMNIRVDKKADLTVEDFKEILQKNAAKT